jgi:hypothetical protein
MQHEQQGVQQRRRLLLNWLTRMFNSATADQPEKRTSLENPQTPLSFPAEWLLDIFSV